MSSSNLEEDVFLDSFNELGLDEEDLLLAMAIAEEHEQKATPKHKEHKNFNAITVLADLCQATREQLLENLSCAMLLEPEDPDYENIVEYINNSQEPYHQFGIQIFSIIKICQKSCPIPEKDLTNHVMLWHGTNVSNMPSILQYGFHTPDSKRKRRLLQGSGIYFADRVSKSAQYCDPRLKPRHGENGFLFLCDVSLGRSYYADTPNFEFNGPPEGYDSVTCQGKYVPGDYQISESSGSLFPLGCSKVQEMEAGKKPVVQYNEFVVYNPGRVEVKYLIYFTFTENRYINDIGQ